MKYYSYHAILRPKVGADVKAAHRSRDTMNIH